MLVANPELVAHQACGAILYYFFQQKNGPSPFNGAHKGEWSGWHGNYEVRFKLIYSYWASLLGGFEPIS